MTEPHVTISTADGECPAYVFTPATAGPHPAVIFYMDGLAIRPALFEMSQRLADYGYVVLLPDLFYRAGRYEPLDPKEVFASGDVRAAIGRLFGSTDNQRAGADTAAFLDYLASRDDVVPGPVGTTGYCMGGGMSLTAAGLYPDRIAAAASFHGGNLATDADTSPHLLAPHMRAKVYVAGADQDSSYPAEMATRLETALADANVDHHCEIYPTAQHGFTMTDFPVYDHDAAERHWRELTSLLRDTIG